MVHDGSPPAGGSASGSTCQLSSGTGGSEVQPAASATAPVSPRVIA
jgi:hypothetical protein